MPPIPKIANATESIEDFFTRYTRYLTEGNIEGLADMYNYPALAVTAMGCLAITEPQQSQTSSARVRNFIVPVISMAFALAISLLILRFLASG